MADRNKYPPTKTAKLLAYEYAKAHPRKVVLADGRIQQQGKWYSPPIDPVSLCRTLVDMRLSLQESQRLALEVG